MSRERGFIPANRVNFATLTVRTIYGDTVVVHPGEPERIYDHWRFKDFGDHGSVRHLAGRGYLLRPGDNFPIEGLGTAEYTKD